MINLPKLTDLDVSGKSILVRGDFDVDNGNNSRADTIRELVRYLQGKNAAKMKVIGHTETDYDLASQLKSEFLDVEFDSGLRKNPGEKENSQEFSEELAKGWNVYVNEAFATSHREHASIASVPKVIKEGGGEACVGLRFQKEIENLSRVFDNPKIPVIMVISGVKEDKLSYLHDFLKIADKILVGGRLPEYLEKISEVSKVPKDEKLVVANLLPDKEDITMRSIEIFEEEIKNAGTIVLSGPLGKFEDEGHRQGTKMIFEAVANSNAYKVAGGGDTEAAVSLLELRDKFDWISVGGGAMLEYLAKGTLPGIVALETEIETE